MAVDSLLCRSLVVALDTDLKDPYSDVQQQELDYKKVI